MATLVVLKFDTPDGAEKGLELAQSLQKQQLLKVLDAVTVTWPMGKRRPKTRQVAHTVATSALDGAFWGMLLGFIFFVPVLGMAVGAAMGAIRGHFTDYGIDDSFIDQVRKKVTEGTSGLFLLLSDVTTDKVVDGFKSAPRFEIVSTNLSNEQEAKLREAFAE